MGAALMRTPEKAESILKALVENISKPITGKIFIKAFGCSKFE